MSHSTPWDRSTAGPTAALRALGSAALLAVVAVAAPAGSAVGATAPDPAREGLTDRALDAPATAPEPSVPDAEFEALRIVEAADVRARSGELEAAADGYRSAIDVLEQAYGIFDPALIQPVARLGRVYLEMGRYDEALEATGRARHLHRINYGLHDLGQIEHVETAIAALLRRGDIEAAQEQKEYVFGLRQRAFGESYDMLPGIRDMVRWYRSRYDIARARDLLDEGIEILEDSGRVRTREMAELLTEYAETLKAEKFPDPGAPTEDVSFSFGTGGPQPRTDLPPTGPQINPVVGGRRALERARDVIDALPDATPEERAQARLRLGDWYLLFEKWSRAHDQYTEAASILQASPRTADLAMLEQPHPILFPSIEPPDPPGLGSAAEPRPGHIEVSFRVTERGRVRSVEVTESVPEGLMDFRTRRVIRSARFRPRFQDGEPVDSDPQTFRYEFTYFVQPGDSG